MKLPGTIKTFKAVYMKVQTLQTAQKRPMELAEQKIITDAESVVIKPPSGYGLISITELLPDSIQLTDEKIIN